MAYFLDLFSPETYEAFGRSSRDISGFRPRQENAARQIHPGDKLVCYMTKLSRWFGVLKVESECFIDKTPIFYPEDDPFIIRFKVRPLIWLPKEKAIPIHEDIVWQHLSFTQRYEKNTSTWTGKLRNSLNRLTDADGKHMEKLLLEQADHGKSFEVDESAYKRWVTQRVRRLDRVVSVSVPQDEEKEQAQDEVSVRESYKQQALLADIGTKMGFNVWLPRRDRSAVLKEWKPKGNSLLDNLPLNYDEATLRTIEQIDVLWLKRRSIIRAFEVEHTTAVYSGILRMADLLALQPNMDIKLHIVAPIERRDKVFQEITRPVFSLLDKGPLSEICTFISYDTLKELSKDRHIQHMSDSVLDEYAEEPE
jgi:predicted RNA-binding protein